MRALDWEGENNNDDTVCLKEEGKRLRTLGTRDTSGREGRDAGKVHGVTTS